ncbi:DinB family protein [Chitinimonas sp. JJ19]|uniref:DinB family protein n=1 Tax=Chitinimonas sp. JJ19 TaxID=3109352 RepID=UPI003002EC60
MISWKNHFLYQADYQHWASDKLFESLDKLSDEARKRDEGLFFKSVHGTVNHLLVTNLMWWGRLRGEPQDLRPDQQLYEDWRELKQALKQTLRQTQHWLQAQPAEFFEGELRYRTTSGKEHTLWVHDILTHIATDCAHQRGQASAAATRLGAPAPEMDYSYYRREMQDSLANARVAANG